LRLDLNHSKLYSTIISFSFSADAKKPVFVLVLLAGLHNGDCVAD